MNSVLPLGLGVRCILNATMMMFAGGACLQLLLLPLLLLLLSARLSKASAPALPGPRSVVILLLWMLNGEQAR